MDSDHMFHLNFAITLFNHGELTEAHMGFRHENVCVLHDTYPGQKKSLKVDDMDGYQDEGYEEAILPTDFVDGRDGDYSVICTNDLHDVVGLIQQLKSQEQSKSCVSCVSV
eukprot:Skav216954  [mRNA]  locus=scaffold4155:40428:43950:+ [translate_table: standard]